MPQPKLFQEFDPNRVKRLRDAWIGIGRGFDSAVNISGISDNNNYASAVAATYFRRAAANSILVGEFNVAREWFGEAARCYRNAGMPYGVLMEAMRGLPIGKWRREHPSKSAQDVYGLFAALGGDKRNSIAIKKIRKDLDEFRGRRLGVFAIPVDQYLELFDALYAATKELDMDFRNLHTALLPFVQAYSSALERAKRDRFHWERLAMVFHPIEPDVVGLLAMIRSALRRIPVSHIDFLEGLPISHDALTVLHYCIEHTTSRPDNRWQGDNE